MPIIVFFPLPTSSFADELQNEVVVFLYSAAFVFVAGTARYQHIAFTESIRYSKWSSVY